MNKIFVLTGEPSGDKLASNVIKSLNEKKKDIEYLGFLESYKSGKKEHMYRIGEHEVPVDAIESLEMEEVEEE